MTTEPVNPVRINPAVVKNVAGLLLLVVAAVLIGLPAWAVDWKFGMALSAVPVGYAGWSLATSEK